MIIHSTRIVHDHQEILPSTKKGEGWSIGGLIDEVIARAVSRGEQLGKVELVYEDDEWRDIVSLYDSHAQDKLGSRFNMRDGVAKPADSST